MKLEKRKFSSKEIAEWFGIAYQTYRKTKQKRLKELEDYCEFKEMHGGLLIKEVYIEEYNKNLRKHYDTLFLKNVLEANEHLSTVSGIARKEKKDPGEERTLRYQFTKSRNYLFGDTATLQGIAGCRKLTWAIKVGEKNQYRSFSPEEQELFNTLITTVYGSRSADDIKEEALIDELYKKSETMTKEDYFILKEDRGLNFFEAVISKFRDITGEMIVAASEYNVINYFDLEEKDKQYRDVLFKKI